MVFVELIYLPVQMRQRSGRQEEEEQISGYDGLQGSEPDRLPPAGHLQSGVALLSPVPHNAPIYCPERKARHSCHVDRVGSRLSGAWEWKLSKRASGEGDSEALMLNYSSRLHSLGRSGASRNLAWSRDHRLSCCGGQYSLPASLALDIYGWAEGEHGFVLPGSLHNASWSKRDTHSF